MLCTLWRPGAARRRTLSSLLVRTVEREIFVNNTFSSIAYDDKDKNANFFNIKHRPITLHFRCAKVTKIKQRKNLTDEYFYKAKIS